MSLFRITPFTLHAPLLGEVPEFPKEPESPALTGSQSQTERIQGTSTESTTNEGTTNEGTVIWWWSTINSRSQTTVQNLLSSVQHLL